VSEHPAVVPPRTAGALRYAREKRQHKNRPYITSSVNPCRIKAPPGRRAIRSSIVIAKVIDCLSEISRIDRRIANQLRLDEQEHLSQFVDLDQASFAQEFNIQQVAIMPALEFDKAWP
jgi:hypothetical protein